MPDYSSAKKTELSELEQQDQFLLRRKGDIVQVLQELAKRPDIITGYFNAGANYILTSVVAVLPERNLVVLDCGPDEAGNELLLKSGRLLCVTRHDHINIKFAVDQLQRARFQGISSFAAPLPESLYRLQRREFFRIRTPIVSPVTCITPWGGSRVELTVLDLGYGGLALCDADCSFAGQLHDVLPECELRLPEFGKVNVDLEVCNLLPQRQRDGTAFQRVGCSFRTLTLDRSVLIQRYLHRLQVAQKALLDR